MKNYYQINFTKNNCTRNSRKWKLLFFGFLIEHQRTSQPGPCQFHQVLLFILNHPSSHLLSCLGWGYLLSGFWSCCSLCPKWNRSHSRTNDSNVSSSPKPFPALPPTYASTPGWINHFFICFTWISVYKDGQLLIFYYSQPVYLSTLWGPWSQEPYLMEH